MAKKQLTLARKIREMKIGQSFEVATDNERVYVNQAAKHLRDAGVISFRIVTRAKDGGGFTVVAVNE